MMVRGLPGGSGGRRAFAVLLFALLLALAAGGCGGKDNATSTSTHGAAAQQPSEEAVPNGEKSIEDFGEEATGGERARIVASFKGQLRAIAVKDLTRACSYMSVGTQEGIEQFGGGGKKVSCSKALSRLIAPSAPAVVRDQVKGPITKVRVGDDRAFVVFHAPGAKLFMMSLVREGSEWKTTIAFPSVLVPNNLSGY